MTRFYTIKDGDVGESILRAFGQAWLTMNFIGQILPIDVGKRVYRVATDAGDSFILQVENNEQRDKRISGEKV